MKRIEIKEGRVIDPVNNIDKIGALYISDGKIAAVFDKPQGFEADEIIDVKNAIVCPGFIDLSARLREPGQTQKATFRSETKAAASAGITS
ncbi:MAG: dihydroorotase, partial [Methylococcales bacterium]|nr:dihydroorotase [Methylococcales bacterium]